MSENAFRKKLFMEINICIENMKIFLLKAVFILCLILRYFVLSHYILCN